jgi:hypothetical protein
MIVFRRWAIPAAWLIVVTTLAALWLAARAQNFLACDMECGETLLAIRAADQFAAYGVRFGLLEALGPDDAPLIYTHSVNIGTLTFVLLQALGVEGFAPKLLLPLAAYGLGLFYVFLTVRRATGSELVALVTLLIFATTYWGLGAFAMNALRAWHILGFFAVAFHALNLVNPDRKLSRAHLAGLALGAVVAFGCGYDFWLICGAVAAALLVFERGTPWGMRLRATVALAMVFALPFVARQLQVAWALGAAYWWQDFLFTLAIKIPYAGQFIALPPMAELDAWYRAHGVLRPPATATNSFGEIFYTFRHMLMAITVPRWGWLALLTLIAVSLTPLPPRLRATPPGRIGASLLLPMLVGMAVGLALLAPFSLHVYFKHEFPLFAFPLLLAKGAVVAWLIGIAWESQKFRLAALLLAALYGVDTVMVHRNNTATGPSNNFGWIEFVRSRPEADFILATYNPALSRKLPMLDKANAIYVPPGRAMDEIAAAPGAKPRFLVYQPIERLVDFDAAVPRCAWRDWIATLLTPPRPPSQRVSCIYGHALPADARPQPSLDDIARLGRVVERDDRGVGYVIVALP